MIVEMAASKKAPGKRPYLATVTEGWSRQFADGQRSTGTTRRFSLDVAPGSIVEGRGSKWDDVRETYVGEYWLALAVDGHGLIQIFQRGRRTCLATRQRRMAGRGYLVSRRWREG